MPYNEVIFVNEIKTALQAEIDACIVKVSAGTASVAEDSLSKSVIYLDPEDQISFVTKNENRQEVSSPAIIIEIDSRKTTQNSMQGTRIHGDAVANISCMVARGKRTWDEYSTEIVNLLNYIETILASLTGRRYLIGDATFSNFAYKNQKVSAVTVMVSCPIGHYEYSIQL